MLSRRHVIADDLRTQILTGRIKADDRLPSEARLASHYRVSTPTLRNALAALQSEGLVEKIHGKGNFVRYPRRRVTYVGGGLPLQTESSDESVLRISVRATSLLARGQLVGLLKVPANSPLTEFVCLNHEGESPHSLARVYIPGALAPTELPDSPLCCGSFEAKLAALRPPLAEIQERVSARSPTPEEAAVLRISPTLAVLAITRVGADHTGRVVEAALLVLPGDRADALFTTHPMTGERGEDR
ncbi:MULTISPECIES: GntR family transcriptional regulator [unclassified Streptomyces]|uniref:GntR family transcriptional regulator n=1 Tax=unclassified Streptomyces TaxID=2593676 RepID=UPI0011CB2723|nr:MULTISPECIES: GntR family transcriptional regulator [unclassified Streptomyces]TXS18943.1 GntR family transcriptional regulator [Streptomyces sp. wa22]WSQ89655.1 GntR family transcriptional regulator [Streptomyces sp. NBC_01212]